MATNILGQNQTFEIKNADGTSFHDLVLHKPTFDSVIMSLGDKITGDVYYKDNTLNVTMQEYIEYKANPDDENEDAVRFVLVNPPTIVREGTASESGDLHGMTKYSFEFYHPMYMLSNFPFTDVAVTESEERYLSESKTFSWIGRLVDFVAKLNANLAQTQWVVNIDDTQLSEAQRQRIAELSEVLSFNNNTIAEALKQGYETWEVPFVISQITSGALYAQGKKFLITFGLPSQEILDSLGNPFVFRFGQGVGLKNNSRTPKNNKIVTRIMGYGSEDNIPYGYPQIVWTGNQSWDYTINNRSGIQDITIGGVTYHAMSYPIYDGIVGGESVRLIKHPFTRTHLMPTVYVETVNKKVNPRAIDYNPETTLIDYYDSASIIPDAPSVEIHEFEKIKPELGEATILGAEPYQTEDEYMTYSAFMIFLEELSYDSENANERKAINELISSIRLGVTQASSSIGGAYTYSWEYHTDANFYYVLYTSDNANFKKQVLRSGSASPTWEWDDSIDDEGNYKQSYFKMTLPTLSFDLYASAAITQEMQINMRSGACIGCTFDVMVDWDDYKKNFYSSDGRFSPSEYRDYDKYPDSSQGSISIICQKDTSTFGTLMPNVYQQPASGDKFVVLGISMPTSYITNAQVRLDSAMQEYMLENSVYYYEYPLKFDEHFLANNTNILLQMKNNSIVRFEYAGVENVLYIKQITIKWGEKVLPQYNITLTDDVEIVLNQIGQVTDDVSRVRVQMDELHKYYGDNVIKELSGKLSRIIDDVAQGRITFQQGLNSLGSIILDDEIRSDEYESGLYLGKGWRIDKMGNAELEALRVRSYLEVVELLVNRLQAQEGDTLFSDNDQIQMVEEIAYGGQTYYRLSLKEKWAGYITAQKKDNIIKGIINTLAAKDGQVSDVEGDAEGTQLDGQNTYYTSWMIAVDPPSGSNIDVGTNQLLVTLYGDGDVPAQKNFKPCELMTIARWGCLDASASASAAEKADVERRQRSFYISTTDGRITKMRGVNSPILRNDNYGTTLGVLPDFVRNWSIGSRLIDGRDYLYAQGIVVGDFIKVDAVGAPIINIVDKGEWANNTAYLANSYNAYSLQWETHEVWHNDAKWRCRINQPVTHGSVSTYYEPSEANSLYWEKLFEASPSVTITPTDNVTISCGENNRPSTYISGTRSCQLMRGSSVISNCKIYSVNGVVDHDAQSGDCGGECVVVVNNITIAWEMNTATFDYRINGNAVIASTDFDIVVSDVNESIFQHVTFSVIAARRGAQGQQGERGADGERGALGRSYYYDGFWADHNASESFYVTDAEAPYYAVPRSADPTKYNYYVWVGENGTYAFNNENMPSNENENWQIMYTDFRFLMSEAVFSDFAKLGSGVFNQDWMYSQYGANGIDVWSGSETRNVNSYIQVGNTAYNPSNPVSSTNPAYVPTANHFKVIKGRKYTVYVTSRATSGTFHLRVYYADGYNNISGNAFISFSDTTSAVREITFYAEFTGDANIASYGNGVVTKIHLEENTQYTKMSPLFVNGESTGNVLTGSIPVYGASSSSLATSREITRFGLYLVAGMSYRITISAFASVAGGTATFVLCKTDTTTRVSSNSISIIANNTSLKTVTATFVINNDFSGYASIRGYMNSTAYNITVSSIIVEAVDPFIPTVAIDWLTGYAHFGGDKIRFNPDGSGKLANGNIIWDESGNAVFEGEINARSGVFSGLLKKRKTIITEDNKAAYIHQGYYDANELDFEAAGTFVVFSNLTTLTAVYLPSLYGGSTVSEEAKDSVRALVGNTVILYNEGSTRVEIRGASATSESTSLTSFDIESGEMVYLECRVRKSLQTGQTDKEEIYWLRTKATTT